MIASNIHQYPYIRLIIPWIAGVFCGDCFFNSSPELLWGVLSFSVLACLSVIFYFLKRHSLRWCFGISVYGLCFVAGWIGVTSQLKQSVYTFPKEEVVYRAELLDTPKAKERTFLCRVFLKEWRDSTGVHTIKRKALLYLEQDSTVARLQKGAELWVSARISPPANGGNFDEFDYARYLMRQSVSGTGYVASGRWALPTSDSIPSGHRPTNLRYLADSYREKINSLYRRLGFDGEDLAVLSALTIGDKTDLSESVRESFSISGASHVLALSGLHIGLLYALFFFLLNPVVRRGSAGRYIRSVVLLLLLWTFAFFTGLSPSVVRSVSMFSILALADLTGSKSITLNTLAATAWVMLLFNPVWLFDVGFQLSFLAVASILLIGKPVNRLFQAKSRIGKYIWGLISVSIAAQLGTAPLVILYFSRFPTHFLLTNLVVIPLVTLILHMAVLMLLLTPFSSIQWVVAEIVGFLLKALNGFVRWVEQLPYASVDGIWLYKLEVLGVYLVLLLFLYYWATRRFRNLIACLFSLLVLGICHVVAYETDRPQTSIVFYNVRDCPAVHCIGTDGSSYLNFKDSHAAEIGDEDPHQMNGSRDLADKKRLQRVVAGYRNHHHLLPPKETTADYQDSVCFRRQQLLSYHGCRICMVTDNRWGNKSSATPLYIQYLYLCKGYDGHLEELTKLFFPSTVLLDSSLPEYRKQLLEAECRRLGFHFISLSDKGSVCFLL